MCVCVCGHVKRNVKVQNSRSDNVVYIGVCVCVCVCVCECVCVCVCM